jgi:hypothetical protein
MKPQRATQVTTTHMAAAENTCDALRWVGQEVTLSMIEATGDPENDSRRI